MNSGDQDGEPRLGDLTLRQFLRRHWQRKPLLVRDALRGLPGGRPPQSLSPDAPSATPNLVTTRTLFALARDPDVESRLVFAPESAPAQAAAGSAPADLAGAEAGTGARAGADTGAVARAGTRAKARGGADAGSGQRPAAGWRLRHGPFRRLPSRQQPGWTLLVQGVDLHLPAARALMDRFRFLPDARLDDLMISFATAGGGVGPHADSYDVFLLQIAGRRRWRIAAPGPGELVPGAPLRLLARFEAEQTWLLEPGDMLYLPPGWGHDGTAVDECMTCSIGFRSPSRDELRRAFFGYLADQPPAASPPAPSQARYRDNTTRPVPHPAEIPGDMARTLGSWVRSYRPPARVVDRFIGRYLTEPKPSVWFDRGDEPERQPLDAASTPGATLVLDRKTRMLYRKQVFYVNGEALDVPPGNRAARRLLAALADGRSLDAEQTARVLGQPWLCETLEAWLDAGWLRVSGAQHP